MRQLFETPTNHPFRSILLFLPSKLRGLTFCDPSQIKFHFPVGHPPSIRQSLFIMSDQADKAASMYEMLGWLGSRVCGLSEVRIPLIRWWQRKTHTHIHMLLVAEVTSACQVSSTLYPVCIIDGDQTADSWWWVIVLNVWHRLVNVRTSTSSVYVCHLPLWLYSIRI